MKTVIKDELTEAEAREAHKADILSGNDGVETGKRAGLIAAEIAQHRADFSARKRAAETLTVTVPKLQEQADGLKRESARLDEMAKRPFTSLPLSTWLAEIGLTDAPIEKLADLPGIAMTFMLKRMAAGSKAMDAQAAAEKAKREAAGLLRDTASRALHDCAKRAADAMGFAMNQMQAHDQFLREIDGAVRDCEWRCNQLFSGRRVAVDRIDTGVFDSPTASPIAMLDNGLQEQREVKALYLRERRNLTVYAPIN